MSEDIKNENKRTELSLDELDVVAGGRISFRPLKEYMKAHGITQYQLIKEGVILPAHVTRLSYDHNFTLKFIDKLCNYLNCQPGDIIEYIPEE